MSNSINKFNYKKPVELTQFLTSKLFLKVLTKINQAQMIRERRMIKKR